MILNFIIHGSHPFSLVDQVHFKKIIQKGFIGRSIVTRPTLMKNLNLKFQNHVQNLEHIMAGVDYLTTTADCWSIFKR